MARKRNSKGKPKGWYCFSRDLLSSQRYRRCSWATKGVYFDTLNVLSLQTKPGSLCLKDFDLYPKKERSLTQRCLACQRRSKNGEYQSIKYFAEAIAVSASGPRPGLIHGLQELYLRGIIVIEGDTLIQPRMFRDNGFDAADLGEYMDMLDDENAMIVSGSPDDGEADPDAETMRMGEGKNNDTEKSEKGTKKDVKKPRVGTGDAPAQSKRGRVGVRDNNKIDSNKGVQGGVTPVKPKTQEKSPITKNKASEGEKKSGTGNLSSDAQKRADSPRKPQLSEIRAMPASTIMSERGFDKLSNGSDGQKIPVADQPPTLREIQDYMQQRGEGGDPFRHITAEQFYDEGCMSGWTIRGGQPLYDWRARLRSLEGYRRKNGEPAVTEEGFVSYRDGKLLGTLAVRMNNNNKGYEGSRNNQRGAARSQEGHTESDDGMLQQSVRIISRLRASREAEGSDGTDSDGDPF